MSELVGNALGMAASGYLRSGRHQPVQWQEWGQDAFAQAQSEGKPVLLVIGASWCHWCHVMDRESYENAETAALINEHFVAVRVDRDERPDVDARHQAAVAAISGQAGWPLTALLTPEGKPFFGGGYFPPEDRYGRPGLRRVLGMMAEAFYDRRDEVNETAESVISALEENESLDGRVPNPGLPLLSKLIGGILQQHDARNGGFGSQPKFPHAAALELLIAASASSKQCASAAKLSLRRMAAGGLHDQLGGGFHRYSTDEHWLVPHFEKMAYDNAALLTVYAYAYTVFGDEEFAETARSIIRWMDDVLCDRERGGFYSSQNADATVDSNGDYFTWTRAEAAAVLTPYEFRAAELRFNLRPVGDMQHNPAKNVLQIGADTAAVARALEVEPAQAEAWIASASEKLLEARALRPAPYVDQAIYSGVNGMCISAYLAAARALNLEHARAFALKSLDRVLSQAWSKAGLAHVVAYGDGTSVKSRIPAMLDEYASLATAALDARDATGESRYLDVAQEIADDMLRRFYDASGDDGFFDTEADPAALGALVARHKPLQDSPTPSGNSVAAAMLLRLAPQVADGTRYADAARKTLETFAGIVEHLGLYAASYGLALGLAVDQATS